MRGINLLGQDLIRAASTLHTRQAGTSSQQDIKSAFSYCVEQVRCAAANAARILALLPSRASVQFA